MSSKSAELRLRAERVEAMERYKRGHDPGTHWRTGRKIGRTIYAMIEDENLRVIPYDQHPLIGVMDTPELAAAAVQTHNDDIDARNAR